MFECRGGYVARAFILFYVPEEEELLLEEACISRGSGNCTPPQILGAARGLHNVEAGFAK